MQKTVATGSAGIRKTGCPAIPGQGIALVESCVCECVYMGVSVSSCVCTHVCVSVWGCVSVSAYMCLWNVGHKRVFVWQSRFNSQRKEHVQRTLSYGMSF